MLAGAALRGSARELSDRLRAAQLCAEQPDSRTYAWSAAVRTLDAPPEASLPVVIPRAGGAPPHPLLALYAHRLGPCLPPGSEPPRAEQVILGAGTAEDGALILSGPPEVVGCITAVIPGSRVAPLPSTGLTALQLARCPEEVRRACLLDSDFPPEVARAAVEESGTSRTRAHGGLRRSTVGSSRRLRTTGEVSSQTWSPSSRTSTSAGCPESDRAYPTSWPSARSSMRSRLHAGSSATGLPSRVDSASSRAPGRDAQAATRDRRTPTLSPSTSAPAARCRSRPCSGCPTGEATSTTAVQTASGTGSGHAGVIVMAAWATCPLQSWRT